MNHRLLAIAGFFTASLLAHFCFANQITTNVTLNGLTVDGGGYTSFTDPGTGVQFSNPSDAGGGHFIIDFFNATASLPDITPGPILSSGGYVGNGAISVPSDFRFTMTLPTPSSGVSMIMDYFTQFGGPAGSVLLQGFDSANNLVASDTAIPPTGFFAEQPLSLSSTSNNIVTVTLTPTNIGDNFGAITYTTTVPEPTSISFLAVSSLLLSRRLRHPSLT